MRTTVHILKLCTHVNVYNGTMYTITFATYLCNITVHVEQVGMTGVNVGDRDMDEVVLAGLEAPAPLPARLRLRRTAPRIV